MRILQITRARAKAKCNAAEACKLDQAAQVWKAAIGHQRATMWIRHGAPPKEDGAATNTRPENPSDELLFLRLRSHLREWAIDAAGRRSKADQAVPVRLSK
jgi:hypothetical protein